MSEVKVLSEHDYIEFGALLTKEELGRALLAYKDSEQYPAVLRYYAGCVETQGTPLMLTPLELLKQALASLQGSGRRRRAPSWKTTPDRGGSDLTAAHEKIKIYEQRYNRALDLLKQPVVEVPKKLHFVWLGGGLGGIQLDYLRVWKKIMPEDFSVHVWHDADGLLVHETNRIIVEAAKASVWSSKPDMQASELAGDMYVESAMVLKRQAFLHIQRATARGGSADEARIDLLVRAYGQNEETSRALREKNAQVMAALNKDGIQLNEVNKLPSFERLKRFYNREMSLRGNLATASDIARALVGHDEGGVYSDIDFLPPLADKIAGIEVGKLDGDSRLGVLQLLLNDNSEWMPSRGPLNDQHSRYAERLPAELSERIKSFAKHKPAMADVFIPLGNRSVQQDSLRLAVIIGKESNALFINHPGSAMLEAIIERFHVHMEALEAVELKARESNIELNEPSVMEIAISVLENDFDIVDHKAGLEDYRAAELAGAIGSYFHDGVEPLSQYSINLTGPGAVRAALLEYESTSLTPNTAESIRSAVGLKSGFNDATEEEKDHSWIESSPERDWREDQKALWDSGELKVRYNGNIEELLKHQSIEFVEGWPLIEGRPVMSTEVLQQLADGLGEPFLRSMGSSHNGVVTFDKAIPLGFDERQLILAQDPKVWPPKTLASGPQTQPLPIAELLNRLANNVHDILELGPLQRLQLAPLVGVRALDNRSFDAVRPQLDDLISHFQEPDTIGGYTAIERALSEQRNPAFLAGLASAADYTPAYGETAVGLKKVALQQPLTLRQWGQSVARIQQATKSEHRVAIAMRLGTVLDSFGDGIVDHLQQDLLLENDSYRLGGRCHPLALAMAAAFSQSMDAVHNLRERFTLSAIDPGASDSVAFLGSVESLHDVPLEDVGKTLARSDLKELVDILEARSVTATLMLNSHNHAMLVAKTFEAGLSTYHFYDPNFGLFKVRDSAALKQALEKFFLKHDMARLYEAYGDAARPTFDLVELQGARIADVSLPGAVKVSQLLQPGALPGQEQRPTRQRIASARGRSLQDNPRLGSNLLVLDSHGWAAQIEQVTSHLQQESQLAPRFVPLFDTLKITPDGLYQMSLIDPHNPAQPVRVVTDDHRLLRIKQYLSERFTTLANRSITAMDPTEVAGVHTLNAGFAIQALMNALRSKEGPDRPLTLAVRLQAYVNYAQLAHGVVTDLVRLVALVQQALADEKLIARTVAPVVKAGVGSTLSEATGGLLQLANVGFDIYQLSTTHNDVERAQFGTQLAFDSAGLVLSVGAYAAGATTAGALLGGAAVILGGLAVGVGALAKGFATIAEEAKQVGLLFDEMAKAHLQAYQFDAKQQVWLPRGSLIVKTVDLVRGILVLDSAKLYPQRDHLGVPTLELDYDRAINVRQELDLPDRVAFTPKAGDPIVLPCTPQTCYRYEYIALPFATSRHDTGFDTARRLEKRKPNGSWQFQFSFYSFPSEYIVRRMVPDYRPTYITVLLGSGDCSLMVPRVPQVWQGKITYKMLGGGRRCTLVVHPGVGLRLESTGTRVSTWFLDAPWARESNIRIEGSDTFFIDDVQVVVIGAQMHEVLLRVASDQVLRVELGERKLIVLEEDVPPDMNRQMLQQHFKMLAQDRRLAMAYTPVHHYVIPFENPDEPRQITAWYDASEDRFLYLRNDVVGADKASLSGVVGGYAYFFDPQDINIWQVDAITGLASHCYKLWIKKETALKVASTIKSVNADPQGVIHVVQEMTREDKTQDVLVYVIHDGQLLLSSVTRGLDLTMDSLFNANETLADWSKVLGGDTRYKHVGSADDDFLTVNWAPAPFVSVCWQGGVALRDMAWVRRSDLLVIRPMPERNHYRGWPDSIKDMTELTLLAPTDEDNAVFVIYDKTIKNRQKLCRRRRTLVQGKAKWSDRWMRPENLENVIAVQGGYVALMTDGSFFNLTPQGTLEFAGLSEAWFKDRTQWWSALQLLSQQHATQSFALVGLGNLGGDAHLCAWYVGGRLLLADLGHGKEVRLLSVTPDHGAAWLFDVSTGVVYRQRFIEPQRLDAAFGQGTRLLLADALPAAQREWAPLQFSEVTVEGTGLRGVTFEGVVVTLRNHEPAVVTGVTHEWVVIQGGREQEGLRQLVAHPHSALLTVENPDSLKWFVTETERMVQVPRDSVGQTFEVVGTQQQTKVLLHESAEGRLLAHPGKDLAVPLVYVQRDAEVLVVEAQARVDDLLPLIPDGVLILVLRMGRGAVSYRLSTASWLRLESIVLDCRPLLGNTAPIPGKLIWTLDDPDTLLLTLAQEHLVIIDPDTGHSLVFREVYSADINLRGEVLLSFGGHRHYAISALVQRLGARQDTQGSVTLKALLSAPEVEETV